MYLSFFPIQFQLNQTMLTRHGSFSFNLYSSLHLSVYIIQIWNIKNDVLQLPFTNYAYGIHHFTVYKAKNIMDPCPVNKEWQQLLLPTLVLLLELWFFHAWLMFLCLNARQLDCGMFCKLLCQIHIRRRSFS